MSENWYQELIKQQFEDINELQARVRVLEYELEKCGCKKCDIPACDCEGYHNTKAGRLLNEKIDLRSKMKELATENLLWRGVLEPADFREKGIEIPDGTKITPQLMTQYLDKIEEPAGE